MSGVGSPDRQPPSVTPPFLARLLLRLAAPARLREQVEGDLLENYVIVQMTRGGLRARWWYWMQVMSVDWVELRRGRGGRSLTPRRRRVTSLIADLRYALRLMRRNPGYTATIVGTLAIAIGANTAIVTVVNNVLLRPLPYADSDQLVMVFRTIPRLGFTRSVVSYPDFADWREQANSFHDLAAYRPVGATYLGPEGAERWQGYRVTANTFQVLGVVPVLGRVLTAEDDRPGSPGVILLSHALWQSRFGGDPSVVGRTIALDGEPRVVAGVMSSTFDFPSTAAQFWFPLQADPSLLERDSNFLVVFGRLRDGVGVAEAQDEMRDLAARIDATAIGANRDFGVFVESRRAFLVRNAKNALVVFLGAVTFVLLVACANVAHLTLARGATRQREIAVRVALGAGRARLGAQLVTESAVLGFFGGALGVAIAYALLRMLVILAPTGLPRRHEIGLDMTALVFTALLSICCGFAIGMVPAVTTARADPHQGLREGGQGTGIGRLGRRLRQAFVITQVSLAMVLSVGAGLLINSFMRLTSVELGFDPVNVVAARVSPVVDTPVEESERTMRSVMRGRARFYESLLDGVVALPGVQSVGLAYGMPLEAHRFSRPAAAEGTAVTVGDAPVVDGNVVAGSYFETMGIAVLRGRAFNDADGADAPDVALVNESLARLLWPDDDPIGKRIRLGDGGYDWVTVIGIVRDTRLTSLDEDPRPLYYRPLAQAAWPDGMFVVTRWTGAPGELVAALRRVVSSLDPRIPITDVSLAQDLVSESTAAPRFRTIVLSIFGGSATLLALVGIYGVIAHAVSERRRELGIRLALGATRWNILRLVFGTGLGLTVVGVALGTAAALGLTRFLSGMLFELQPNDPATFIVMAVIIGLVSVLACYPAARRAADTDPQSSLRYE